MNFVRLYGRVLGLLGSEARLGWILAGANVALAAAQFGEPVLFGRIIDALVGAQTRGTAPSAPVLVPLLAAWAGFGLFTIACSVTVALHADRLAHRRRQVALTDYFEHVLQLPLSYHGGMHSGRLMKVMLTGTDAPMRNSPPGFGLHEEVLEFVRSGLTPAAALRAATYEPARYFGALDSLGTIARGKLADLVLLDGDPLEGYWNWLKAKVVVKGGVVVVDKR